MVNFETTRWRLPTTTASPSWGYGTSLIPIVGSTSILLSLPTGGPRTPWCLVDLVTGETTRGTGMPGHLRAAVFPTTGDPRPWVLATHGLGRLHLHPRPRITDVTRKGIGKYPSTLLDLGHGLLGVGHRLGRSLLTLSATDGTPAVRLRVPGPQLSYPLPDGRLRVLGLHHGQATDLDIPARRVSARHQLPHGSGAHHTGDTIIALLGDPRPIAIVDDVQDAPPGMPVVLHAGPPIPAKDLPQQNQRPDLGWHVIPRRIAVLDAITLQLRRDAPAPPDAVDVFGVDHQQRIIVTTQNELILLDPATLTPIATHSPNHPIIGAAHCPHHNLVALLPGDHNPAAIHVLTW